MDIYVWHVTHVKAFLFLDSYPLPLPKLTIFYAMCQLDSNFTSLHHSLYCSRWRRVCSLEKADYQQWTMKPVLINRLKVLR